MHPMRLLCAACAVLAVSGAISPAFADRYGGHYYGPGLIDPLLCQTDYEIRRSIAEKGFTNIYLNSPIETHIRVRATKGKTVYLIDYNYCFPEIVSVTPLRSAN
jgi:hypothetical protein